MNTARGAHRERRGGPGRWRENSSMGRTPPPMRSTHGTLADRAVVLTAAKSYHVLMNSHRLFSNRRDEPRSYGADKLDMCIHVAVGAREPLTP